MGKLQLAMLAWQYRNQILIGVLFAVLLPGLLFTAVISTVIAGTPMVRDDLIPHYQYEAVNLTAPDGSKVGSDGKIFVIDWQLLAAVDAVKRKQEFEWATGNSVKALAQKWIKEVPDPGGDPCTPGDPHCVCVPTSPLLPGLPAPGIPTVVCSTVPHTTYQLRTLDEVLDELKFTPEQRTHLAAMGPIDTSILCGPAFSPNPLAEFVWPIGGEWQLTDCFGPRVDPVTGEPGYHWGVDIAAPEGTIVRAATGGTVYKAQWMGNYGWLCIVNSPDGTQTWYAHLLGFGVWEGQVIEEGHVIGAVGSTGKSTGPHLHFEIRTDPATPVNPLTYYQ